MHHLRLKQKNTKELSKRTSEVATVEETTGNKKNENNFFMINRTKKL